MMPETNAVHASIAMTETSRSPTDSRPIPLQYANDGGRLRRRIVRWSICGILLLGVVIAGWLYGPHAWLFAQQYYWRTQCMNFSPPPDMVVYERLPAGTTRPAIVAPYMDGASAEVVSLQFLGPRRLSKSLRQGNPPVEVLRVPECWVRFMQATGNPPTSWESRVVVAFCHERISPAGHKRLVAIEYPEEGWSIGDLLASALSTEVYEKVAWNGCPRLPLPRQGTAWNGRHIDMPSRVFAGQCDPADASHFSIEYEWPTGLHGFIDGRLGDDDTVRLTIRPGSGDIESERRAEEKVRFKGQHR
jgi:hypothetical protein